MSFFQNQIVKMLTDMLSHVDTPAFILDGQAGRLYGWNDLFAGLFPQELEPGTMLADLLPCREVIDWLADYYQQKFAPDENWRPGVWSFLLEGLEAEPVNVRLEIIHFGEKTGLLVVSFSIIRDWLAGAEPDHLGTLIHDFTGAAAFMDMEGRFQIANQPMSEFLKLPMSEIINSSFMDIFPDDISWPLETIFHRAISSGNDQLEEMETKATGESVWLQVMFNVVRKNGQNIGAYFSAQDTRRIGTVENEEEDNDDDFFNIDFDSAPAPADDLFAGGGQAHPLLNFSGENFEPGIRRVLALVGEAAGADRVDIWQIHKSSFSDDPEQYISQLYEWSAAGAASPDAPVLAGRLLSETIPNWVEAFAGGESINELTKHMPEQEKKTLEELGIVSILAAPITVNGALWGFIGLQDCTGEHRFSQADERGLVLVASLLEAVIQNQSLTASLDEARRDMETVGIKLEQALNREKDWAEQAQNARESRSQFLGNMQREIVPPTNAILEMIELIAHSSLTEGQREFLDKADLASKTLLRAVGDIMDLGKIRNNELTVEAELFSLSDVLGEVEHILKAVTEAKKLDLKIMVARGLPAQYIGDQARLIQILTNLAAFAINSTEKGAITIKVDPAKDVDYLAFSVRDTGSGLSRETLDTLFTHLGPALARELIFLMGGEFSCESEVGQGTVFYFTVSAPKAG